MLARMNVNKRSRVHHVNHLRYVRDVMPSPSGEMEVAADVIAKTGHQGEAVAIAMNKQVARDVRQTMRVRGATMPENLPIEPPIAEVEKAAQEANCRRNQSC